MSEPPVPASVIVPAPSVHVVRPRPVGKELFLLCAGSLGVVYGDIGTSPLYAMRLCFTGEHGITPTAPHVLGVMSLMAWSLIIIICFKYLAYVTRADNHGEGGILALTSLTMATSKRPRIGWMVTVLGLLGAALLYGDGMITPAISVLGAVEGLEVLEPRLAHWVVPLTIGILVVLFTVQRRGTGGIGAIFGPVTFVWFITIGVLGIRQIMVRPDVLWALNPWYAVSFLAESGWHGFLVLGGVLLVVTGAEALYADMGHFGARPIRLTWFVIVLPALLSNYLGQAALLLERPAAAENPFYHLVPAWGLIPMIALATLATAIASQALISGAFSLTRQASMLGFWPRVKVRHTSAAQMGQIYVPIVNWLLMFASIGLVLGFKSSESLAAAYGIANTATWCITTLLAYRVARQVWDWSRPLAVAVTLGLLLIDGSFFAANTVKIADGGWFPLVVGVGLLLMMTTWKQGRNLLAQRLRESTVTLDEFYELIHVERPARVPGSAIFMTGNAEGAPPALMRNFLHNRVVHTTNIMLTVLTEEKPRVEESDRLAVALLSDGFVRVTVRYGYMEEPDIPAILLRSQIPGFDPEYATYFFGRELLLAENRVGMAKWRKRLFTLMAQNSQRATAFFHIPPDRVVEIGSQVML